MPTDQTDLKPCPFCGEKYELQVWPYPAIIAAPLQAAEGASTAIICSTCGALGPRTFDGSETTVWNIRQP